MHFLSILGVFFSFITLANASSEIIEYKKDPCNVYGKRTYVHENIEHTLILKSITDEDALKDILEKSNEHQQKLANEDKKPYQLNADYIDIANKRCETTAFYGLISPTHHVFFNLGNQPVLYGNKDETTDVEKGLNNFFEDLDVLKKINTEDDSNFNNMKVTGGVASIAYAIDPNSMHKKTIEEYACLLIDIIQELKNKGHKLPNSGETPVCISCIAPGYDKDLLELFEKLEFTCYTKEDKNYGKVVEAFFPDAHRVFLVKKLK